MNSNFRVRLNQVVVVVERWVRQQVMPRIDPLIDRLAAGRIGSAIEELKAWDRKQEPTVRRAIRMGGGGALALIMVLIVLSMVDSLKTLRQRIDQTQEDIRRFASLSDEMKLKQQEIERAKRILRQGQKPLGTLLEEIARKHQLVESIESMKDRETKTEGDYTEQTVEVAFRNVPLAALVNYLYDIEYPETKAPQRVSYLRLKPTHADRKKVDVTLRISTLVLKKG